MALNRIDSGSLLNITQSTATNKKANLFESMVNQEVSNLTQNSKPLKGSGNNPNLQLKANTLQNSNIQSK
ncbi:hypothetical protein Thena_1590 [Thermodesulfobium narugense DSM 14796]|uniref:Uncharacterized protein n=1 Tax=Thermodesulfobium narugense DSM 14796 TaxID=747365 RepID=M1E8X8_9BACT|nr:hypothetical protein [Thermodesulfobium narugense]AEE15200.1 hypothetical protein Thena_1590 [Thermodesulfobium narugense DSM 14796]